MYNIYLDSDYNNKDPNAKLNFAVALYIATYMSPQHTQTPKWSTFKDFMELSSQNIVNPKYKNFDKYKKHLIAAENGDQNKIEKLIREKKLFCIPWMLVGDLLIDSYPDLNNFKQ